MEKQKGSEASGEAVAPHPSPLPALRGEGGSDDGDAPASLTIFLSARERERAIATLGRVHTDRTRAFLRLLDGAARGAKA